MSVASVADLLSCPVCAARSLGDAPLHADGRRLTCSAGHGFDLARQGYVNLLGRTEPGHADTAPMVAARERFLDAGAYAPLAQALVETSRQAHPAGPGPLAVLEAGAGPGWYLERVLGGLTAAGWAARGVALDVSVAACRRAAVRASQSGVALGAVVGDVWGRLPVLDATLDLVLSVFAPRHAAEFARVLRPGGALVVLTPRPGHLSSLRSPLGLLGVEVDKQAKLEARLGEHLFIEGTRELSFTVSLDGPAVADLAAMGPTAFHVDGAALTDRLERVVTPVEVPVEVQLATWRRPAS